MGTFRITAQIGSVASNRFQQVELLVDTGASYTQVPAALLQDLGVRPLTRRRFGLADGRHVTLDVGEARIRLNGDKATTVVVFGPEGAGTVLGAVTLEELGLAVDPLNQRLVPVEGLLMSNTGLSTGV
ncbi:MAG: retroviral-like aspartic protease family protein [Chloroflexi bacterium]|nr:retroviral-like aspartic protease family protein [Chloroflexota bacterium]